MASTRPPGTYSPSARTGRRGGDSGGVAGLVRRAGCDALPLVDTANPAISGVPRRELSSTSRRPVLARWSGPWCASCEGRTSPA